MMEQLRGYGMEVMVSAWPFSAANSSSFEAIGRGGLAFTTEGSTAPVFWDDNNCHDVGVPQLSNGSCYIYDATNPAARAYFWSRLRAGYYSHGIRTFWLDASEPEISTAAAQHAADNYNSSIGTGEEMGMMFPYYHTQSIHDGLVAEGESEVVMLTRSAWAGMQRFGAALWSGDTRSRWDSLKVSIQAGLNTQISGIALWTTDIGGYAGGNPGSADFRELIVRWFQFGMTCPLFRQHGARDTAPWGYGQRALAAIEGIIARRNAMRPYVMDQFRAAAATGRPVNRPLWWDFPDDPAAVAITTQYMFGDGYMVAPVTDAGATSWPVYFPAGATYTSVFTNKVYRGGQNATVPTPLEEFPLFAVARTERGA